MKIGWLITLILGLAASLAQGTFQNLDFESANIIPDPASPFYPHAVSVANGLPGWTAYEGTFGGDILYDTLALGDAAISIHDTNGDISIMQGNYTLFMQGSQGIPPGAVVPALGQVGTVPNNALSLRYYGQGPFAITFAGQPVPVSAVGNGPNYTIFGGDISAYAGQTGELRFQGGGFLDNIFFSPTPIPEPGVVTLSTLGTVLLAWRFLRRTRP